MSKEIFLQRFDQAGGEEPKHPAILQDFIAIAREHLQGVDGDSNDAVNVWEDRFTIELPGGTAVMHANYGQFPIEELDALTLHILFEIARVGDMVIVVEGGKNRAILTDASQRERMPDGWLEAGEPLPVCHSAGQLEQLLLDWYTIQSQYKERVLPEGKTGGVPDWVPGTRVDGPASYVYIEARPGEKALMQRKALDKHYFAIYKAGGPHRPEKGMMMAHFCRVETPAGRAFYAYGYGGDKANWLAMIRDFAVSEGRATGQIDNFDTFVQDDGQHFALSSCTCARVTE